MKRSHNSSTAAAVWMASLLTGITIQTAFAQDPGNQNGPANVSDIIVTAQKRSQSLNDIPSSISAFDPDSLTRSGISDTKELELLTPGLVFNSFNGGAQPYVRGIGAENAQIATESPFAVYVDGVYRPALYAGIQDLSNVERVEVLLGPQGTLYGRNSTAGAMNIITRNPSSMPEMSGSISYGNRRSFRGTAYMNGGSETIAANIAILRKSHEGFVRNLVNGDRIDNQSIWTVRGKVKFTPDDRFSAILAYDFTRQDDTQGSAFSYIDPAGRPIAAPLPIFLGGQASTTPRRTYVDPDLTFKEVSDSGLGLTLRYAFDDVDLVSITGASRTRVRSAVDQDSSTLGLNGSTGGQIQKTFSQEVQLVSTGDADLSWLAGLYTYHSTAGFTGLRVFYPSSTPSQINLAGKVVTHAFAAFGQLTYAFSDRLSATGGLRYSTEKKSRRNSTVFIPETDTLLTEPSPHKRWSDLTPEVTLKYDSGAHMVYGKFSQGFKSGNFNALGLGTPPVNPEKVTAFEIGGKHAAAPMVQLNWSAFYYRYIDLQISSVQNNQVVLENASRAKIYGADLTAQIRMFDGLNIRLGGAYLHGRYQDYRRASIYSPDPATGGYGNVLAAGNASGNDTVRSPKWTGSAAVDYAFTTGLGEARLSGNFYYNDGFFFDVGNSVRQKAYGLLNARAELDLGSSGVSLFVFGNNLTDRTVISGMIQASEGNLAMYNDPRIYGVGANVRF
ncbi:MAG: TonB-dependent receptor [Sphingobium sp.]